MHMIFHGIQFYHKGIRNIISLSLIIYTTGENKQQEVIHEQSHIFLWAVSRIFLLMHAADACSPLFHFSGKKATDSESVGNSRIIYARATLHFMFMDEAEWREGCLRSRSLSFCSASVPPSSSARVCPLGQRGGDGRDWNELVREQMEQRRPRATPGLSRL